MEIKSQSETMKWPSVDLIPSEKGYNQVSPWRGWLPHSVAPIKVYLRKSVLSTSSDLLTVELWWVLCCTSGSTQRSHTGPRASDWSDHGLIPSEKVILSHCKISIQRWSSAKKIFWVVLVIYIVNKWFIEHQLIDVRCLSESITVQRILVVVSFY